MEWWLLVLFGSGVEGLLECVGNVCGWAVEVERVWFEQFISLGKV